MGRRIISDKELAPVLGLKSPQKVSQSIDPALTKIARVIRAYPLRGWQMLIDRAVEIDAEERAARLNPMGDAELERRIAEKRGRADR